jgi:hypothetical protein
MQFQLLDPVEIAGVATLCGDNVQLVGHKARELAGGDRCVVEFRVSTSLDGQAWTDTTAVGGMFVAPATMYTDVATPNLFETPVWARYVRFYPLAATGNKLSMRAALIRKTPLQPASVDCTNTEGVVATSTEWAVSTKGFNLVAAQTFGGGSISLDACKALAEEQQTKFVAWTGNIYNGFCRALKRDFAACAEITQDTTYGYQLYERFAGIPTSVGTGAECDELVADGSCTHKCLNGYVDNNGGAGQTYTCPNQRFVGTPLTCTAASCDASTDPDNGSVLPGVLAFGRYLVISRQNSFINLAEVQVIGGAGGAPSLLRAAAAVFSQTYGSHGAANCIDDKLNNMCHSAGPKPWLVMDFGEDVAVLQITVYNRVSQLARIVGSSIKVVTEHEYNHAHPEASTTQQGWSSAFISQKEVYAFGPSERMCTADLRSGDECIPFCDDGFTASGARHCLAGNLTDSFVCRRDFCPASDGHSETGAGQKSTVGCDDELCAAGTVCPTRSRVCDVHGNWNDEDSSACKVRALKGGKRQPGPRRGLRKLPALTTCNSACF